MHFKFYRGLQNTMHVVSVCTFNSHFMVVKTYFETKDYTIKEKYQTKRLL